MVFNQEKYLHGTLTSENIIQGLSSNWKWKLANFNFLKTFHARASRQMWFIAQILLFPIFQFYSFKLLFGLLAKPPLNFGPEKQEIEKNCGPSLRLMSSYLHEKLQSRRFVSLIYDSTEDWFLSWNLNNIDCLMLEYSLICYIFRKFAKDSFELPWHTGCYDV